MAENNKFIFTVQEAKSPKSRYWQVGSSGHSEGETIPYLASGVCQTSLAFLGQFLASVSPRVLLLCLSVFSFSISYKDTVVGFRDHPNPG